jgi:integrase
LNRAGALGHRSDANPARWRGHLDHLLPRRSKVQRTKHHPALPYPEISAFVSTLQGREGIASLAMEFLILTAARTGEVTGAEVREIDRPNKVWTIPRERMKAGIEHRVPLSPQALDVLARAQEHRNPKSRFLFPSYGGAQLSPNALLALLHRMGRDDLTTHGFRSTFRDWAAETTNFPNHVVEMALAHVIRDQAEAAYRRGDLFAKRAALMSAWANYCFAERGKVLPMSAASDAGQ